MVLKGRGAPERVYFQAVRGVPELQRDCPNLYVCQDFMRLVTCWQNDPHPLPLFAKAAIRVAHLPLAATEPAEPALAALPAGKAGQAVLRSVAAEAVRFRINVKLALFSGVDIAEKGLYEKEEASLNHFIQFLVLKAVNKDQIFLVGGQFGLVADLQSVSDAMLIAKLMFVVWLMDSRAASSPERRSTSIWPAVAAGSA